jgi:PIN domain nuclease of toxin-antitoxin system
MRLLLDTHLLLWAAQDSIRLSGEARSLIEDPVNEIYFSVVSLWEIAIKKGLGQTDFQVDARVLRRELLDADYQELVIASEHVVFVDALPLLHKDPFDRLLVAQATVEGIMLLTQDNLVAGYSGPIRKI